MKYEIIKTKDYLLVVDESEIKGWYYDAYINKVKHSGGAEYGESIITRNIIAHLPLNGSPILEGVDLLPPLPLEEDDIEKLAILYCQEVKKEIENHSQHTKIGILGGSAVGFMQGYNKAKEKYKYTEEDMRKAIDYCKYNRAFEYDFETIIQSLSQPKMPIGFECVTETRVFDTYPEKRNINPKTTTTPEGHTQWVGTYIYV